MHKVKGLAMHIEQRVAGGLMSVLCLGILLGALILPSRLGTERPSWRRETCPARGRAAWCATSWWLTLRAASVHRSGNPHQRKAVRKTVYRPQLSHIRAPTGTSRWRPTGRPWFCAPHLVSWGGLGLTIPDMAVLGADLLLPALRATGVVALLPPHVRPC